MAAFSNLLYNCLRFFGFIRNAKCPRTPLALLQRVVAFFLNFFMGRFYLFKHTGIHELSDEVLFIECHSVDAPFFHVNSSWTTQIGDFASLDVNLKNALSWSASESCYMFLFHCLMNV